MQKAIRRADTGVAGFFALELSDSENRAILSENLEAFLDESYS